MLVTVDTAGLGRAEMAFRQALAIWSDTTPLMDEIGAALLDSTLQRFEDETGLDGEGWAPLHPKTVRQRGGDDHPILRRSGELYRSLTYRARHGAVDLGSNKPYAGAQQLGNGERNIPARPFFPTNGLPPDDQDAVAAIIHAALRRGFLA